MSRRKDLEGVSPREKAAKKRAVLQGAPTKGSVYSSSHTNKSAFITEVSLRSSGVNNLVLNIYLLKTTMLRSRSGTPALVIYPRPRLRLLPILQYRKTCSGYVWLELTDLVLKRIITIRG